VRALHVFFEAESRARCSQRLTVPVAEDWFLRPYAIALEEGDQKIAVSGHSGHMRSLRPFPYKRTCGGVSSRMSHRQSRRASEIRAPVL